METTHALPLSVIVPVYKVEQYLPTLLDSILAQTYKDYELLLIDDGSPDGSGKICDDYAARDERVRVIHKENGGVSSARNRGIEEARGEYLYFCDSDDYLAADMFEVLMREVGGRDLLRTGYLMLVPREEGFLEKAERTDKVNYRLIADNDEGLTNEFPTFFIDITSVCRLLLKRSILIENNLRFSSKFRFGEDTLFVFEYLTHIHSAILIDYQGYCYFHNAGSAIYNLNNLPEYDIISAQEKGYEALEQRALPKRREKYRDRFIYVHLYWLMKIFLLKGYLPQTAVPRSERLKRWATIREDKWFNAMRTAAFRKRQKPYKMIDYCCRYRLYYLADPLLWLLGKKGKLLKYVRRDTENFVAPTQPASK